MSDHTDGDGDESAKYQCRTCRFDFSLREQVGVKCFCPKCAGDAFITTPRELHKCENCNENVLAVIEQDPMGTEIYGFECPRCGEMSEPNNVGEPYADGGDPDPEKRVSAFRSAPCCCNEPPQDIIRIELDDPEPDRCLLCGGTLPPLDGERGARECTKCGRPESVATGPLEALPSLGEQRYICRPCSRKSDE